MRMHGIIHWKSARPDFRNRPAGLWRAWGTKASRASLDPVGAAEFGWEYDGSEDRCFRVLDRVVGVEDLVDMRHVDQRSRLIVHRSERDLPA